MLKAKSLMLLFIFAFLFVNIGSAQVKNTKALDSAKATPRKDIKIDTPVKKADTVKVKYQNPGKIAGRKAVFKSLIIPGWGQLYNNQLLRDKLNARGEKTGHFWQKTYTLSKVGIIYGGFTLLTLSYIDNTNNYRIFLKEAQFRQLNPTETENPDLKQYSTTGITNAQSIYKRNRQIIIFSYVAVYAIQVIDAYVAARLNFFNIDDSVSMKITPSLISNPNLMYGFNAMPALKVSLKF